LRKTRARRWASAATNFEDASESIDRACITADANADGSVSYLELAAFVDTATGDVKNPNMRLHVYARGPFARDEVPIVELRGRRGARRFRLSDAQPLRVRLRDREGLPLLDAHAEAGVGLGLTLPEAWKLAV
jgi:hypothetical protein